MKKKLFYIFLTAAFRLLFYSCSVSPAAGASGGGGEVSLKVLNWNLQTFFDASFDGTEYSQFRSPSALWSVSKYEKRLDRLSEVISACDADVIIFEELENSAQLHDIYNRNCSGFNFSKNYGWACFAKEEGSSIGCAVMSRYPLSSLTLSSLDIRSEGEVQPSMRPLLKVFVNVKNKQLLLLVNHWKSKSGGAEASEIWRNWQERVLAREIAEAQGQGLCVFAAGDFNRDIFEFDKINEVNSEGFNITLRGKKRAKVYSPWFDETGKVLSGGSYYYSGSFEKIDHFFAGTGILLRDFKVETSGPWAKEDGTPFFYYLKSGEGYSDHLPLSCTVCW